MKSRHEHLNDRLEQITSHHRQHGQDHRDLITPLTRVDADPEIDELVTLAQRLQTAPQLEVVPNFKQQLQRRLLRRHAEIKLAQQQRKHTILSFLHAHPIFRIVASVCIFICIASTSLLVLAAQVSNPNNPLYRFKLFEQHIQITLAGNAGQQAALDLQFAQERLNTLATLTGVAHTGEYQEALIDFDQSLTTATSAINALPASSQRTQLLNQLATLRSNALQDLHSFLTKLALPERLATTNELARLGESVPHLASATLILPDHPNELTTIVLVGSDIQPGAQLLMDGKLFAATGTLANGQITFAIVWHGDQHPQLLGLLNPDGTATQIQARIIKTTGSNKNGGGGDKNGNGNGNKPTITPTPHH